MVAVFGEAANAQRKIRLLARTPAIIHVFADDVRDDLRAEFARRVSWHKRSAAADIIPDCRFAIIAEEDPVLALAAFEVCRIARVPVNTVDRKAWCDFTVPSLLSRGRIVAAVASGGSAPVLARTLRGELEAVMAPGLADLSALALSLRAAVRIAFSDEQDRRRFWERFFEGAVSEAMLAGDKAGAMRALDDVFRDADNPVAPLVTVVIAPDGPPDLISLRAYRALRKAEQVFLSPDLEPGLLDLVRRDADRAAWKGDVSQTLDEMARGKRCVIVLKAGAASLRDKFDAQGIPYTILH